MSGRGRRGEWLRDIELTVVPSRARYPAGVCLSSWSPERESDFESCLKEGRYLRQPIPSGPENRIYALRGRYMFARISQQRPDQSRRRGAATLVVPEGKDVLFVAWARW
jgi:hypothetical protein